eukprot:gene5423-6575_t
MAALCATVQLRHDRLSKDYGIGMEVELLCCLGLTVGLTWRPQSAERERFTMTEVHSKGGSSGWPAAQLRADDALRACSDTKAGWPAAQLRADDALRACSDTK